MLHGHFSSWALAAAACTLFASEYPGWAQVVIGNPPAGNAGAIGPGNIGNPPTNIGNPPSNIGSPPTNIGRAPDNFGRPPTNIGSPPWFLGNPPGLIGQPPRFRGIAPGLGGAPPGYGGVIPTGHTGFVPGTPIGRPGVRAPGM